MVRLKEKMIFKPKHQQLCDLLESELQCGTYRPGEKLPAVRDMAQKYSVSINIVSKAIEQLKSKHLILVKAGDGIYANIGKIENPVTCKFSGKRLFGQYDRAKIVSVLVEDYLDYQKQFWNATFDAFIANNPDIELKVDYFCATGADKRAYDLFIGGFGFMNRVGIDYDDLLEDNIIDLFAPGMYHDKILTMADLSWKGTRRSYPLCFRIPEVLSLNGAHPEDKEDLLDFVDRLAAEHRTLPGGYKILTLAYLLTNAGCEFIDYERGTFAIRNPAHWMDVLKRIKKLYEAKDILIIHGQYLDFDKLLERTEGNPVRFAEISMPLQPGSDGGNDKLHKIPYPFHRYLPYCPTVGAINGKTDFPEEVLRLMSHILTPQTQEALYRQQIALPVDHATLRKVGMEKLAEKIRNSHKVYFDVPSRALQHAVNYFLIWEFYYYLNGRVGDDILARIERKVRYFMENHRDSESEDALLLRGNDTPATPGRE